MSPRLSFSDSQALPRPILALAPMQDVTDHPFWKLMATFGGVDLYFTEYFRVHPDYKLHKKILRSITENPTGKPVIAQMIGNDVPSLVRSAKDLQQHEIAAVDLNLGCPAPVVYKKCAGGGLLRELNRVDSILGALRDAVETNFTVKTRIGFDDPSVFEELLPLFLKHSVDLVSVHGRTVKEMYRSEVHYDYIQRAVEALPCPVLANGNIGSAKKAQEVWQMTGAAGLMVGRGAIRNPWIFSQIRQYLAGEELKLPTGREVLSYIDQLYDAVCTDDVPEVSQVQKMKKYLNFLGLGVDAEGQFLYQVRRVKTRAELMQVSTSFLDHSDPMPLEPLKIELQDHDVLHGAHD